MYSLYLLFLFCIWGYRELPLAHLGQLLQWLGSSSSKSQAEDFPKPGYPLICRRNIVYANYYEKTACHIAPHKSGLSSLVSALQMQFRSWALSCLWIAWQELQGCLGAWSIAPFFLCFVQAAKVWPEQHLHGLDSTPFPWVPSSGIPFYGHCSLWFCHCDGYFNNCYYTSLV